jgi:AcrR family transcriptional regulator
VPASADLSIYDTKPALPIKARGRPSQRKLKREALLDGATALFNARGIAGTSLSDIAERLGLARASVYYYVNDRAELVFQCYQRACERTADDLATASQAGSGFQRVYDFITLALAPERPPTAVLNDLGVLDASQAEIIARAIRRNTAGLIAFLKAGMADDSVRSCDSEVVAQCLFGILAWAQMTPQWVSGDHSEKYRKRLLSAALEMIDRGIAIEREPFVCSLDADLFMPGPLTAFNRCATPALKVEQLLRTASGVFNRQGIEATSLDQIVAELGASKAVVYHYLRDKSDLVTRCYERGFDLFEQIADKASTAGRSGMERVLLISHLNSQGQAGALTPLMPQPGLEALANERRGALTARARALSRQAGDFIQDGIADGSCRSCDTLMVAQISAGAFGRLRKWLPRNDPRAPRQLADEITAFLGLGLATDPKNQA